MSENSIISFTAALSAGLLDSSIPPHVAQKLMRAPVSNVRWVHRDTLHPNNYNPNKVAPPEMELLIISIEEDGFTQPVVISRHYERVQAGLESVQAKYRDVIVDGFHRFTVSGEARILAMYHGYVPVVFLTPKDVAHQMMSTVRHNRARGTHGVLPMAEIVQAMIEVEKLPVPEIMRRLGMEKEEVVRLANRAGIPQNKLIYDTDFSNGWTPE